MVASPLAGAVNMVRVGALRKVTLLVDRLLQSPDGTKDHRKSWLEIIQMLENEIFI